MKKLRLFFITSLLLLISLFFTPVIHAAGSSKGYMNIYNKNGLVLDVKNSANKNGANIQLWNPTNNRKSQLFSWKYHGKHKYSFISKIGGRYLDVYRGLSSDLPIKSGLNIDIWQGNDPGAQHFCFINAGKNYYYIANYDNRDLVLTAHGAYNGANVTLEKKKQGNPAQMWYFEKANSKPKNPPSNTNTSEYVDAYIATSEGYGLNFRTGSSLNDSVIKVLSRNTKVRVSKNSLKNGYYKAIYNGQKGYLYAKYLSFKPLDMNQPKDPQTELIDAHVIVGSESTLNFRSGPSTSHDILKSLPTNTRVKVYKNSLENGFYKATYKEQKGYLHKDYLVLESDELINGVRKTAPTKNNQYYYSNANIFCASGYGPNKYGWNSEYRAGNCTWYAFGRFYEITGRNIYTDLKISGHAGTWAAQAQKSLAYKQGLYTIGSTPKVGAIGVLQLGRFGHVFIVEKIVNGKVYISESAWGLVNNPNKAYIFKYREMPSSWYNSNLIKYIHK